MDDATAGAEASAADAVGTPESGWLEEMWSQTLNTNSERAWNALPEDIIEYSEQHSVPLHKCDILFLAIRATSAESSRVEASASVRLLGLLAEEDASLRKLLVPYLVDVLEHHDPLLRLRAVEALWQSEARSATQSLSEMLYSERNPSVIETIKHTLRIWSE